MVNRQKSYLSNVRLIPTTVWAIGFGTLLMNSSTIILISLMPLYLTSTLGISLTTLGQFEGLSEGASYVIRIFSGPISDMLAKRKPLLVLAYGCASLSRIIFPYASNMTTVYIAKLIDRLGNGLQASPREALIGDVAPKQIKGTCYGLRQTLGLVGSCLGALLAMYIMKITHNNYQIAFWIAVVPALIAMLLVIFLVKDVKITKGEAQTSLAGPKKALFRTFSPQNIKKLNANYGRVLIFAALFTLSYYGGAFTILQAQAAGLSAEYSSMVMVVQNLTGFLVAFPMGILADRFGRKTFLMIGCMLNIMGNLLIAQTSSLPLVLIGIGIWGSQIGMMNGLIATKIAENTPKELRATAFAIFFGVIGLMLAISNQIAGFVAQNYGQQYMFYVSAGIAALALCSINVLPKSNLEDA